MATIAEQLTSLAETKTAIKDAIVAKGVSVADTDTFRSYATKIGEISGGGGASATKYGVSIDNLLGDVDENGVLKLPRITTDFNGAGIKIINGFGLVYKFASEGEYLGPENVYLGDVITISTSGLKAAFAELSGSTYSSDKPLRSIDLHSVETVGTSGLQDAFYGQEYLVGNVNLGNLKTIGNGGLQRAFAKTRIIGVNLDALTTVDTYGLAEAFVGTKITALYFPSLTSVKTNSFASSSFLSSGDMLYQCTTITEIHFRADMQATIEATTGYSRKWSATNATIYFDL